MDEAEAGRRARRADAGAADRAEAGGARRSSSCRRGRPRRRRLVEDADAVLGHVTPEVVAAGKRLRWVQAAPGGVTPELLGALNGRDVTVTASDRVNAPQVADATFALLLGLTRNLLGKTKTPPVELRGKTLLVVGLGGAGEQVARRGQAFGMRVLALDDEATERPAAVAGTGEAGAAA
ncbi:MAG: NAD(P)-dependent oxidoreductase [Gemmataceae bacterium]